MSPARKRRRASMDAQEPNESQWSPAQGMQAFGRQQRIDRSFRQKYVDTLSFRPDEFQIQAMDALEAGSLWQRRPELGRRLLVSSP